MLFSQFQSPVMKILVLARKISVTVGIDTEPKYVRPRPMNDVIGESRNLYISYERTSGHLLWRSHPGINDSKISLLMSSWCVWSSDPCSFNFPAPTIGLMTTPKFARWRTPTGISTTPTILGGERKRDRDGLISTEWGCVALLHQPHRRVPGELLEAGPFAPPVSRTTPIRKQAALLMARTGWLIFLKLFG